MLNVYKMEVDYNNYKACVTNGRDSIDSYSQLPMGKSIGNAWYPLTYKYATQPAEEGFSVNVKSGDFIGVEITDIGLSPMSIAKVGPLFAPYGELLPLNLEGDINKVFWFHCTNVIDALDLQNSQVTRLSEPDGTIVDFQRYAFFAEKIKDQMLFQIPKNRPDIFCLEPFKTRIESLGLTGLRFRLAWTDEAVAANNKVKSQV